MTISTIAGVAQPGQWVAKSTRLEHRRRDARPRSPVPPVEKKAKVRDKGQVEGGKDNSALLSQARGRFLTRYSTVIPLPTSIGIQLEKMSSTLAVWLRYRAGLSRSLIHRILQAIALIITTTLLLVQAAMLAFGTKITLPEIKIPVDIRAAYSRHYPEPPIIRTVCCPKCFKLYYPPYEDAHEVCQWKPSPGAKKCNEVLWKMKRKKGVREAFRFPRCQYSTQGFTEWLRFFLSRKVIDDALHATHQRHANNPPLYGGLMRDVQDSPAWQSFYRESPSPYNLMFGIYVDWFNIYKSKRGGKSALTH